MQSGASRTGYRLVFGIGRILIDVIEGVLNVQACFRTGENESRHRLDLAAGLRMAEIRAS
jgi:hypothetical protein